MRARNYITDYGKIHYWISRNVNPDKKWIVFLPGLTADHRLFDKQVEFFDGRFNVLVWDAPAHGDSWPFDFKFDFADLVCWLNEIMKTENVTNPIVVGQSLGGYIAQMYAYSFPQNTCGLVSIDSSPLDRSYYTRAELWLLKHTRAIFNCIPWKVLLKYGVEGVSTTEYGRRLMKDIMLKFEGNKARYVNIISYYYKKLAQTIESQPCYQIKCPSLIMCGKEDRAASTKRYNKEWERQIKSGRDSKKNRCSDSISQNHNDGVTLWSFDFKWIDYAGHNSNTDAPDQVNRLLFQFFSTLQ